MPRPRHGAVADRARDMHRRRRAGRPARHGLIDVPRIADDCPGGEDAASHPWDGSDQNGAFNRVVIEGRAAQSPQSS
ncbi:MAG: hypothetical protein ACRD36_12630, partial [Candidatus Acidiferrum sp.]